MTPAEILDKLNAAIRMLTPKNEDYKELAMDRADKYKKYRVALARKIVELRDAGNSVTLIRDIVRGDETIAQLKFEYELSLVVERACLESIKDLRVAIDTRRSQLTWERAEMGRQ